MALGKRACLVAACAPDELPWAAVSTKPKYYLIIALAALKTIMKEMRATRSAALVHVRIQSITTNATFIAATTTHVSVEDVPLIN